MAGKKTEDKANSNLSKVKVQAIRRYPSADDRGIVRAALRLSEKSYRRIVETTNEGIWIAQPDGKTIFVNQRMAEMLGCTREEMIGRTGLEFLEEGQGDLALTTREELKRARRYSASINSAVKMAESSGR